VSWLLLHNSLSNPNHPWRAAQEFVLADALEISAEVLISCLPSRLWCLSLFVSHSSPRAHHYYELVKTECVTFTCESKLITDAGVVRGCDAVLLLVRGGFWHVGQLRLVQSTATQHLQVIHPSRPSGVRAQPVSACISQCLATQITAFATDPRPLPSRKIMCARSPLTFSHFLSLLVCACAGVLFSASRPMLKH
jgi:hypothetical protein